MQTTLELHGIALRMHAFQLQLVNQAQLKQLWAFFSVERREGGRGWTHNICTDMSHLHCMIEVAVCGALDADGGHSSTGVGSGLRNEPGVALKTSHSRSNKKWLDSLAEVRRGWVDGRKEGGGDREMDGRREVQREEGRNLRHIELISM